ncbi:glycosyltransferase family 2 protein [Flavobacterium sp. 7A]|uniref:glycosyltransferase family 2 protein n=1 Tax=Flavobacterium sp. 7A TaxID=2940571 RepID=UPI002227DA93|nr:glycosyltransferase family 2 protein [Flavobacterium sp. 7A]MCW2119434.1 GT2 family glycosyltransferase [Flavobacterium sp. 7A]
MKKVFVIIVTYNGMKWLPECLASLVTSTVPVTILVIDNNSTDGSASYIEENYNDVILFKEKVNLGFGKANNIGLAYALGQNADYVFLLNQDAFVEPETIQNLINVACEHQDYGIISPVQLEYSGNALEMYFYKFMACTATRNFYSDFVLSKSLKAIYEVPFIQAAAWLLPISTLRKIGGFDPIFFHYGEDDNYCQRVLFHNLKIGVVPNVYIRHDSNMTPKPMVPLFSDLYFLNYEKQLYIKYGDLNCDFSVSNIKIEKNKIFKLLIFGCLSFNSQKIKGAFKQLTLLKECNKRIRISRKTNEIINAHYIS